MANKNFIVKNGITVGGTEVVSSSGVVTSAALGGQTLASGDSPTFNNLTLTNDIAVGGDLNLTGDLNITGDVNSLSVTDLDVTDQTITLGAGQVESASGGSGIIVDGSNASILWNETNDVFDINKGISITGATLVSDDQTNDWVKQSVSGTTSTLTFGNTESTSGQAKWEYTRSNGKFKGYIGANAVNNFMSINPSGDIGIGTDSPAEKLHLYKSSGNVLGQIQSGSSGVAGLKLQTSAGASTIFAGVGSVQGLMFYANGTSEAMRIASSGNVGIGRNDPTQVLEVHKATGGDQTVAKFSAHNYGDTGKTFIEIGTENGDGSSRIGSFNDTGNKSVLVFDTHSATSGQFTERMRIDSSGNVGIGTASPAYKLDLGGAMRITASRSTFVDASEDATAAAHIFVSNDGVGDFSQLAGNLVIQARTHTSVYRDIIFAGGINAASDLMRITGEGKVGIGETSPDKQLHIKNTATGDTGIVIENTNNAQNLDIDFYNNGGAAQGRIRYAEGAGSFGFAPNVSATDALHILYDGKVGIGTSSPTSKISVVGGASDAGISIKSGGNAGVDPFRVTWTSGTEGDMFIVDDNGNVGIGTNSPDHDLHIESTDPTLILAQSGSLNNANSGRILFAESPSYTTVDAHFEIKYDGLENHLYFGSPLNQTTDLFVVGRDGNVGIGTDSPECKLHISNNTFSQNDLTLLTLQNGNGTGDISTPDTFIDFVFKDTNANVTPQARIGAHAGDGGDANTQILEGKGYLTFHTSDTTAESGVVAPPERMRIESDGTVCVNATGTGSLVTKLWAEWNTGTANRGPAIFTNPNAGTTHRVITVNTGGNSKLIVFDKGFASKGSISTNGSSVSYNTTSDYRLKENISYTFDATTRLKQLKPARFNFIEDETNTLVDGFIAHEVSSVVPEAVTGEKDAIDDDNPIYQEMDASKLIPLLVKTIQEMEARISELEG